jgi:secretion/DNA translocation related CpaE-like protein
MTATTGVLAMVGHSMRDDVDRVAAAAGVTVVHASEPSSRQAWTGALAVLLDVPAARHCVGRLLPRRGRVILLSGNEPQTAEWEAAISVGAQHVITMPSEEGDLVAALTEAAESSLDEGRKGAVAAVMAGRGGAGASTFATALAQTAVDALLIDADPWSGGIDLVLGSESEPGLRWPDLALESGRLNVAALRQALPQRHGVRVLSNSRTGGAIEAGPLAAVIDAGRRGGATVVCDLPRRLTPAVEIATDAADLVVLITTADVRGCAATAAVAPAVCAINPNVGLVVRGPAPGGLRSAEVARIVGLPLLAAMRPQPRLAESVERGGLRMRRRSPLAVAARQVLTMLQHHPSVAAA